MGGLLFQVVEAPLARVGLIERAANDIAADRQIGWQHGKGAKKDVVAFPLCESSDEADADDIARGGRKTAGGVEIELGAVGGEFFQVDGVPDRVNRHARLQCRLKVFGNACGVGDDCVAASGKHAKEFCHDDAGADVVVNVPDQRRGCRFGPCSEYVHLEAIRVDEVGLQFVQQPAE